MRLIRADSIVSWNSFRECRTVHRTEYVDWAPTSCLFTPKDIKDPVSLLEEIAGESNPLTQFLTRVCSKPVVEAHRGYVVTRQDSGLILRAIDQAMDALKQAIADLGPLSLTLAELLNVIIQGGPIHQEDLFASTRLSAATQSLLESAPDGEALVCLNRLLLEDAFPEYIRRMRKREVASQATLVFVSHRWITPQHPDPDGTQLRELQRRLRTLSEEDQSFRDALVFYDYSSMLQRPRTAQEEDLFHRDLDALQRLCQQADKFLILSEGYVDYKNRGWCFLEFILAKGKTIHLFDDQAHTREDIGFFSGLMAEPSDFGVRGFVTSEKLGYKVNFAETEVIVLAFQHLGACRTTHAEDLPMLRLQLARYFNSREMTAFGRLVTAIAKFFDVALVVASGAQRSSGPVVCKPYLGQPQWQRLPVPGRQQPSKFAVPRDRFQELSTDGYMPILRLTVPGVSDYAAFLQRFQSEREWEKYVIAPSTAADVYGKPGAERDCFPTVDYVIHTVLERPPGLIFGPQGLYIPITRDMEDHLARKK
jgi:hypothetical protein